MARRTDGKRADNDFLRSGISRSRGVSETPGLWQKGRYDHANPVRNQMYSQRPDSEVRRRTTVGVVLPYTIP
jgi:hypothetical protein